MKESLEDLINEPIKSNEELKQKFKTLSNFEIYIRGVSDLIQRWVSFFDMPVGPILKEIPIKSFFPPFGVKWGGKIIFPPPSG